MLTWSQIRRFLRGRIPGQLVIQFTDRCNARCPQCGMRVTQKFPRSKLSSDEVRRILDAAAERGITAVSFTGGEPLLYLDEVSDLIRYAGSAGIEYIRTGTNGFLFADANGRGFEDRIRRIAEKLAATPLRNLWISVDSAVPEVHERMRGFPGLVRGLEKALPALHEFGVYPSANLGINRNVGGDATAAVDWSAEQSDRAAEAKFAQVFGNAFREFYRFIIDLGFTMVSMCYPMSVDEQETFTDLSAVYSATSADSVVRFTVQEKAWLFATLLRTVPAFRDQVRVISPCSSLYALHKHYAHDSNASPYPCRGGIDFFFIDSKEGNTYPCGYRGNENLGPLSELDFDALNASQSCLRCDWECFRDPSELFGPFVQGLSDPIGLIRKFAADRAYIGHWLGDLNYCRACDFFNGRKPPDFDRLRKYGPVLRSAAFRAPAQSI